MRVHASSQVCNSAPTHTTVHSFVFSSVFVVCLFVLFVVSSNYLSEDREVYFILISIVSVSCAHSLARTHPLSLFCGRRFLQLIYFWTGSDTLLLLLLFYAHFINRRKLFAYWNLPLCFPYECVIQLRVNESVSALFSHSLAVCGIYIVNEDNLHTKWQQNK